MLACVLLLGLGIPAFLFVQHRLAERKQNAITQAWQEFEEAAKQLNVDEMTRALTRISALSPNDPLLLKRRRAMDRMEADADDPVMIEFWMNRHLQENRLTEAAREARKRIMTVPDDWQSNCILAHQELRDGHPDIAKQHLTALPSPLAGRHPVGPGSLQYAFRLHQVLRVDDGSLRMYRATKLVPVIRAANLHQLHRRERLQLLECYLQSFEDLGTFPELPGFWVSAIELIQGLITDASMTDPDWVLLGKLGYFQLKILDQLVKAGIWTAAQAGPLERELTDQIEQIWERYRAKQPTHPEGYLGLALLAERRGDLDRALQLLADGRKRCGQNMELLTAQSHFLQLSDPYLALNLLESARSEQTPNAEIYRLIAETAIAAGRPDRAIEACRAARELSKDQTWTGVLEAALWLEQERPVPAIAALKPFASSLHRDPRAAELFLKALALSGARSEIPPLIEQLSKTVPDAQIAIPALRVALREGFPAEVANACSLLIKRFPEEPRSLTLLLADSHLAWAEPTEERATWHKERAEIALNAYLKVQRSETETDLVLANNITWLQLKAFDLQDAAAQSSEPLRKAEQAGTLPAAMLDTLGAVMLARGNAAEAKRLHLAALGSSPSAGKYIHLARACIELRETNQARDWLKRAATMERSPRETYELETALKLLGGANR